MAQNLIGYRILTEEERRTVGRPGPLEHHDPESTIVVNDSETHQRLIERLKRVFGVNGHASSNGHRDMEVDQ